jgi:hypothetical protein
MGERRWGDQGRRGLLAAVLLAGAPTLAEPDDSKPPPSVAPVETVGEPERPAGK